MNKSCSEASQRKLEIIPVIDESVTCFVNKYIAIIGNKKLKAMTQR
jgi:hypothetical protein